MAANEKQRASCLPLGTLAPRQQTLVWIRVQATGIFRRPLHHGTKSSSASRRCDWYLRQTRTEASPSSKLEADTSNLGELSDRSLGILLLPTCKDGRLPPASRCLSRRRIWQSTSSDACSQATAFDADLTLARAAVEHESPGQDRRAPGKSPPANIVVGYCRGPGRLLVRGPSAIDLLHVYSVDALAIPGRACCGGH